MKKKKSKGITLIEVIISVTILAILMIPSISMLNSIVYYNSITKSKISNAAIAQKVIEYYSTVDFLNVKSDLKSNSPQYKYIAFNDNPKKNNPQDDNLLNDLKDFSFSINGSADNEDYKTVIGNTGLTVSSYTHVIKVVFTYSNNMLKIDTVVWDAKNRDNAQIEYAILKNF